MQAYNKSIWGLWSFSRFWKISSRNYTRKRSFLDIPGGIDSIIKRLQFEVTSFVELLAESSIASSTYDDDKGQIPYSRRCLIKALLKALGSTTYATARLAGLEESTFPSSLSLIFFHSHKFGSDIFTSAMTLMSELIHKDPTCFSMLHVACLTSTFLDSISEDWVANGKSYPND